MGVSVGVPRLVGASSTVGASVPGVTEGAGVSSGACSIVVGAGVASGTSIPVGAGVSGVGDVVMAEMPVRKLVKKGRT